MNTTPQATAVLMKKKPLAALLGVSVRTIDNWLAKRAIPCIVTSPRMHLFDVEDVKRALKAKFSVEAVVSQPQA